MRVIDDNNQNTNTHLPYTFIHKAGCLTDVSTSPPPKLGTAGFSSLVGFARSKKDDPLHRL